MYTFRKVPHQQSNQSTYDQFQTDAQRGPRTQVAFPRNVKSFHPGALDPEGAERYGSTATCVFREHPLLKHLCNELLQCTQDYSALRKYDHHRSRTKQVRCSKGCISINGGIVQFEDYIGWVRLLELCGVCTVALPLCTSL